MTKRSTGPSPLERRIQRGAIAHYEDPAYYDHTYRRRRQDVRFYERMAARFGGPVLELGVGTGRVALSLVRAGIEVVGIDGVPAMLREAREKADALGPELSARLTLKRADLRSVRLRRRFPLVISPFNVFMHLYERRDVERALATVRRHLAPRGRFVFDVSMPDLGAMNRRPEKLYRGPALTHPDTGKRYHYLETFEYDAPRQVQMVSMIFQDASALDDLRIVPLSQRQFFPRELEALLHYNGFTVEACFGDFAEGALESDSESQVLIVRARR
jgi:SAM-dependent methyltransferase